MLHIYNISTTYYIYIYIYTYRPSSTSQSATQREEQLRRHQTRDFGEHAASALAELAGDNSQRLAKSSTFAGASAGAEVARLRKWHVWCLLGLGVRRGGTRNRGPPHRYVGLYVCISLYIYIYMYIWALSYPPTWFLTAAPPKPFSPKPKVMWFTTLCEHLVNYMSQ